jgi:hypothetical protein
VAGTTSPPRGPNSLAVASFVLAIAGVATCGVSSVVAIGLGIAAQRQIRRTGATGENAAILGIVFGVIGTVAAVALAYAIAFTDVRPFPAP